MGDQDSDVEERCPECGDTGFWSSGSYVRCDNSRCDVNAYDESGEVVSRFLDDGTDGQCRGDDTILVDEDIDYVSGDDIELVTEGIDGTQPVGWVDFHATIDKGGGLRPVTDGFSLDEEQYEFTMDFEVENDEDVRAMAHLLGYPTIEVSNEYWDEKPFLPVDLVNVEDVDPPSFEPHEDLRELEREMEASFERMERLAKVEWLTDCIESLEDDLDPHDEFRETMALKQMRAQAEQLRRGMSDG